MVAYFHGSPGKDRWQVIEKIGIPVNVAAALIVLFLAFGDTDLGASTASVTVENEDGELVERVVAKPEFRRRTSLFSFDLGEGIDEENAWMSYVASDALWVDLTQDDFIEPLPDRMIQQELWGAGHQTLRGVPLSLKRELATDLHSDHFVTGEIRRAGEGYGLAIQLYDTESGRVVAERAYQGPALLPLVDSASVDIEAELDIPARDAVVDLPVAERLSADPAAAEAYGRGVEAVLVRSDWAGAIGHLTEAVRLDPTFARAQHMLAGALLATNRGPLAAAPIRAALENVHRLPERLQFVLKSDYYFMTRDFDRAMAVIDMWAELHPEDYFALQNLFLVRQTQGDREGMLAALQRMYRLNENDRDVLRQMAELYQDLGRAEEAGRVLVEFTERYPDDSEGLQSLASHLLLDGDFDGSRTQLERALLLEPDRTGLVVAIANLDLRTGRFDEALAALQSALEAASSPQDRVGVLTALRTHYDYRGQSGAAIEAMNERLRVGASFMPPYVLSPSPGDIEMYFEAGRGDEGAAHFERTGGRLQPPLSALARPGQFQIALQRGDLPQARTLLDQAVSEFTALGAQGAFEDQVADMRGRLLEAEGDLNGALEVFRSRLALNQGNSTNISTVHRDIGRVLSAMGRLDEAAAETRETLRLWPSSGWAHLQLARVLIAQGDRSAAATQLESALVTWAPADATYRPADEARVLLAEVRSASAAR
jgi:tetratricopeptide (TPR) repeat protein